MSEEKPKKMGLAARVLSGAATVAAPTLATHIHAAKDGYIVDPKTKKITHTSDKKKEEKRKKRLDEKYSKYSQEGRDALRNPK